VIYKTTNKSLNMIQPTSDIQPLSSVIQCFCVGLQHFHVIFKQTNM